MFSERVVNYIEESVLFYSSWCYYTRDWYNNTLLTASHKNTMYLFWLSDTFRFLITPLFRTVGLYIYKVLFYSKKYCEGTQYLTKYQ